ncbi:Replication factor A protein 1, partial [Rhizopus stolonifer]
MPQLSRGAIKAIYNKEISGPLSDKPVLQLINAKVTQTDESTRYRAVVSDGIHYMQALLGLQHNLLVEQELLKINSVIRVNNYTCNMLNNTKMLIIINLDILYTNVETRIGLPAFFHPIVSNYPVQGFEPSQQQHMYPSRSIYSMVSFEGSNIQLEPSLTPIKEISPYKNGLIIKARVTYKSIINYWNNHNGNGKFFSIDLLDQSGEIRAIAFNAQADHFFNSFKEGNVYYIIKARVTVAKRIFSTMNNEYQLQLEDGVEIKQCLMDCSIPQMRFNFVKINELDKVETGSTIDAMGVVIQDRGLEVVQKYTGTP